MLCLSPIYPDSRISQTTSIPHRLGSKPQPGQLVPFASSPTAEARRSWICTLESMTVHGPRCGERILGRLASARSCFPKRQPARRPHAWVVPGGSSQASPSRGRVCLLLLTVWYRDCTWPIRLPRRFCTFALHCVSLGACGSSHHRFSTAIPAPISRLSSHKCAVAGCGLLSLSMCHIMVTTTSSTPTRLIPVLP